MATNDFLPFGGAAGANVMSQADYLALTARLNGFSSGTASSAQLNKAWRQSAAMAAVLAQFIADISRQNVLDNGDTATILANLKASLAASSPPTGSAVNAKMSITAASSSATLTADEVAVKSALGGTTWLLSGFNKTINLATTGAGGMDTGVAPINGFVALYAIYNPATGASALLAVNATSAVAPNIYAGGNMPPGYTASALISVWPTNASSQMKLGLQLGRRVFIAPFQAINTTTQVPALTSIVISNAIPPNAISFFGPSQIASTTAGAITQIVLAASITGIGQEALLSSAPASNNASGGPSGDIPILTPQTLFYSVTASAGTMTATINVSGYNF